MIKIEYFDIKENYLKLIALIAEGIKYRVNFLCICCNNTFQRAPIKIPFKQSQKRAISPIGARPSKAFLEANSFINKRKINKIKYI